MKQSLMLMAFMIFSISTAAGQTYDSLWKQADEAERKDLPQTQRKVLKKIMSKAEREGRYGHLLKALLKDGQIASQLSPDSLEPFVSRLAEREQRETAIPLQAVLQAVLGRIYGDNPILGDKAAELSRTYKVKAMSHPQELSAVEAGSYEPFVESSAQSRYYDHDLLSVIGYETRQFKQLHEYYLTTGNRTAQLFSAIEWLKSESTFDAATSVARLDSLIDRYADLTECGEAAIARYEMMGNMPDVSVAEKVSYIDKALARWSDWMRMDVLRNHRQYLTMPAYHANIDSRLSIPHRGQTVRLTNLRNLQSLTLRVYRVNADGDTKLDPMATGDYKKLKPLLSKKPVLVQTKSFDPERKDYEVFDDSMELGALPAGLYMVEFKSHPQTTTSRSLYYVSNVRLLSHGLPGNKTRFVVVDAVTGQPLKDASLRVVIREYAAKLQRDTFHLNADRNGECIFDLNKKHIESCFVTTPTDRYSPSSGSDTYYNYSVSNGDRQHVAVFTDRGIYRPGQRVQVAAILYTTRGGFEHEVRAGKTVTVTLRDANYNEVAARELTTDEYGTLSTDFMLPAKGLTGRYSIEADGQTLYFSVEEYKRPTFEVQFPEVGESYKAGDTLTVKATAMTYAGVPVQGARVSYRVERRAAWWWISCMRHPHSELSYYGADTETVLTADAVTDASGCFEVRMPMVMPKNGGRQFYNFVVVADVTDQGGETRQGQLSLPLGNRETVLTADIAEKMLIEKPEPLRFRLLNAAGHDINATVSYQIDGGHWLQAPTNAPVTLPRLKSGSHTLQAVYGEDSLQTSFTVFSLADKTPATETDDWFYVSDKEFPRDGSPVTVQVGSSAKNVHIVYAIFAGSKVIEKGAVDKSGELVNRKFDYKESYGNGLTMVFAWIRDNKVYSHDVYLRRPLPDKRLKLTWETFRDRLTPGQQEEWTMKITPADSNVQTSAISSQLMATLYDKRLDQFAQFQWSLEPPILLRLPTVYLSTTPSGAIHADGYSYPKVNYPAGLLFSHFDETCFPSPYVYNRWQGRMLFKTRRSAVSSSEGEMLRASEVGMFDSAADESAEIAVMGLAAEKKAVARTEEDGAGQNEPVPAIRENLQETAFFFPRLQADSSGLVSLKFTLPESLTTWRFIGLAHTKDMMYGLTEAETVAKKDVMIFPNVPRFVRQGDEVAVLARVANTNDESVPATARMVLVDAESENVVFDQRMELILESNATGAVTFRVDADALKGHSLLVCKTIVEGDGFSDGEQHYLPVLPSQERVTVTIPFVQTEPGTKAVTLPEIPCNDASGDAKLTVEYADNPAWLVIQSMPAVAHPFDNCVICQTAAIYVNTLGQHILKQHPNVKNIFEMWRQEDAQTSLRSPLQTNEELKDVVLNETPWLMDADGESEQKQRLSDFFDETLMNSRLAAASEQVGQLQNVDGSWSWWPGMQGSFFMTVEVCEMLCRLEKLTGDNTSKALIDRAVGYLDDHIVKLVDEMKRDEKKGHRQTFPSQRTLQYLYIYAISNRKPTGKVAAAHTYLKNLLKKENRGLSIYDKAMASIVLRSDLFLKSLREWTSYKEGVGRYYDTPRAAYSWRDYRIPTQVAAIEAFKMLMPGDVKTVREMQQWLLHEKRTQAWDTPVNSLNAIYAFFDGNSGVLDAKTLTKLKIDGKPLTTSAATAGIGYVKATVPVDVKKQPATLTAEKTSEGTGWGAVYAQFMQDTKEIADYGDELTIRRDILTGKDRSSMSVTEFPAHLTPGDRIIVRLTIDARRDLDFVEVIDRKAACMEPVVSLSGYRNGAYCAPRDNATHYFFDTLAKGRHVVETEYYIDRPGVYQTGTAIVQCAYAPEYRATTHSQTLTITE